MSNQRLKMSRRQNQFNVRSTFFSENRKSRGFNKKIITFLQISQESL